MVVCRRTYFDKYDKAIFIKNKIYKTENAHDFSISFGVFIQVIDELGELNPISKQTFDKHFSKIEDVRNEKIEKLLK
mgnify:CR=1 FL=1